MAQLHFAYGLDTKAFTGPLIALSGQNRSALLSSLKSSAARAIKYATGTLKEALVAVRYSEEWLDDASGEADLEAKRFVICLLATSVAVPSLGRQHEPSYHVVLKALLADAGWTRSDVEILLRGQSLSSYLNYAGLRSLAALLPGLDDLGGWLGHEDTQQLQKKLEKVRRYFDEQSSRHAAVLSRIFAPWQESASVLAKGAYQRAWDMLNHVNSPNRALFLVLD
jgi:hypothetical protein